LVQWLNECGFYSRQDYELFEVACENGHQDVAQWLMEAGKDYGDWCDYYHGEECIQCIMRDCGTILEYRIDYQQNGFEVFRLACANGHLEVLKWLLKFEEELYYTEGYTNKYVINKKLPFNFRLNFNECFKNACINGHHEMAKFIYEYYKPGNPRKISFKKLKFKLFYDSIKKGSLEHLQWLYNKFQRHPTFRIIKKYADQVLIDACQNNDPRVVKWLYSLKNVKFNIGCQDSRPFMVTYRNMGTAQYVYDLLQKEKLWKKMSRENMEQYMVNCCETGNLDMIVWFYSLPDVQLSGNIISTFPQICETVTDINILEWFYNTFDIVNVDDALVSACKANKLETFIWLFEKREVDKQIIEECFKTVCENNHLDIAYWLTTAYLYLTFKVKKGKITSFEIKN